MMEIVNNNELREALAGLESVHKEAKKAKHAYDEVKKFIVEKFCPVRPGDVVTLSPRYGEESSLHVDVIDLRVLRVEDHPFYKNPAYDFVCEGRWLRKDKTVGKRKGWHFIKVHNDG